MVHNSQPIDAIPHNSASGTTITNIYNDGAYLEGEVPAIVAFGLHRRDSTGEGEGEGGEEQEGTEGTERDALLGGNDSVESRSKSRRRRLKWYQTPSPYWFYPGILFTSLSLGMIIAPKIEIYTELICRSIDPAKSGVNLPPPVSDFPGVGGGKDRNGNPIVLPPSLPNENRTRGPSTERNYGGGLFDENHLILTFVPSSSFHTSETVRRDDTWAKQCRGSAVVQKELIRLATVLTTIMGILSALTTGYWGSLSDRIGRKPVIALALSGTVFLDAIFLIVVHYHEIVGYEFLILGPVVDGLMGGMSTMTAATNAYVTDSTDSGSRAKVFSALAALLFAGIAVGPAMGAVLIQWTGMVLFPFYLALFLHCFFLITALLVIPESLTSSRQSAARLRHISDNVAIKERERLEDEKVEDGAMRTRLHCVRTVKRFFFFLAPLALLFPKRRTGEEKLEDLPILESRGSRVKVGKRDWELTKIAIAFACYVTVVSIMQVKIIYAGFKYDWGAQENGLYLSYIGTCRVVVLVVILPLGIKIFRRAAPLPTTPRPDGPIIAGIIEDEISCSAEQKLWNNEAKYLRVAHDSRFDLSLARLSVFIEIFAYIALAQNTRGAPLQFILSSGLSSLGGAASPAIQSLALALTSPQDTGRLFASIGVLTCVFAQIIGPIFFLVIYLNSITTYPELVFVAGVGLFVSSFMVLSTVRLGKRHGSIELNKTVEETEEAAGEFEARQRGRSATRKVSTHALNGI